LASEGGYGQDAIAAAVSGSSTARRGKRPLRLLERLGELPRVPPTLAGVRQTSVALRRYSSYSRPPQRAVAGEPCRESSERA
jgi:hypothetical protein